MVVANDDGLVEVTLAKDYGENKAGTTIRVDPRRAQWLVENGYPQVTFDYDVYFSYRDSDAVAVQSLATKLRQHGLRIFIDREVPVGTVWPQAFQAAMDNSRTVAVFLGSDGLGPWQSQEVESLIAQGSGQPVFPILLPGSDPERLPHFLRNRIWVDFRDGFDDEAVFLRLLNGTRHSSSVVPTPQDTPLFERLSPAAQAILLRADGFRQSRQQSRIHMEHLWTGLFDGADETVRRVFEAARIDRAGLQEILRRAGVQIPDEARYPPSDIGAVPPLSIHVEEALERAKDLAAWAESPTIAAHHLLRGALAITDCTVVKAFVEAGVQFVEAPGPDAAEESIRVSSAGDQPVDQDTLGFEPYVEAIAEFLVNEETLPPLTLSIEGEWGSGKSSFMLQLEKALQKRCQGPRPWLRSLLPRFKRVWMGEPTGRWVGLRRELQMPCCLTIRFNAWRHDKEDALWAAFASEFLRRIARQRALPRRWLGHFRLFLGRYRWRDGWLEMLRALAFLVFFIVVGVIVPVAATLTWPGWTSKLAKELQTLGDQAATNKKKPEAQGVTATPNQQPPKEPSNPSATSVKPSSEPPPPFLFTWLVGLGSLGAYTAGVISFALKVKEVVGNPLEVNLRKYLQSPDYAGHVAFVEAFHEDFRRIVGAYAGKRKVYVFIDDLDRCEVPKAADLMQALNLLITDDPRLIFIIGMDREKVAAGLAVKYEKLLPYLIPGGRDKNGEIDPRLGLDYGFSFIEKFVQLPFRVPTPKPINLQWFLSTLSGREPGTARFAITGSRRQEIPNANTYSSGRTQEPAPAASVTIDGAIASQNLGGNSVAAEQQTIRRERLKLVLKTDSEAVEEAALMAAPALDNNPRRLKQFVNLFRLKAYIAGETGAFDEVGGRSLTFQQLGKFVAITLGWPGLLIDLVDHPDLLPTLQDVALKRRDASWKPSPLERRWVNQPALMALLRHGCDGRLLPIPPDPYDLSHADLDRLLRVSPKVARTPTLAVPLQPLPGESSFARHTRESSRRYPGK